MPTTTAALLAPATAAILSFLAAAASLQLWEWRPGTPMGLGGDATFVNAQLGRLVGPAWLADTSRLGAPFGQTTGWFPSDDQIHFLAIKIIGLFADSPFTVGGVYFVLGFPASALTAYWLVRTLGCSRTGALVAGVLFSVIPGHQLKYEHLWLAGYWVVPLGLWLAFQVGRGLPLWRRLRRDTTRAQTVRDLAFNLRTVAIILCVAMGDVYFLAFTLIMLAAAAAVRRLSGGRGFAMGLAVTVVGLGAVAGTAIVASSRGKGADLITGATPSVRSPGESERFAGKIMDLILPWYHHRLEPLSFLTTAYNANDPTVEHPAIGIVALAGIIGLVVVAVRRLGSRRRSMAPELGVMAVLTVVAIAFYTKGGLGSFVAVFLTPQIRTWSRLYLYVGFFGLTAVAWWLTSWSRRGRRREALVLGALLIAIGIADQTNPAAAPPYAAMRARIASTTAFTDALESRVPAGCAVFQLPLIQFPESPAPKDMLGYDHLVPFLTSHSLKWSYGAMRGTAKADWQLGLPMNDPTALAADVRAAGFCAIEVDSAGYDPRDNPTEALRARLGAPIATTTDGRLAAFSLGPGVSQSNLLAQGGRGWQVLHPVVATVNAYPADEVDGQLLQELSPRSRITLGNMTGSIVRAVSVTLELKAAEAKPWAVQIVAPGGAHQEVTVQPWGTRTVTATFDLPVGRSELAITSDVHQAKTQLDGELVSGTLGRVSITTTQPGIRTAVAPRELAP